MKFPSPGKKNNILFHIPEILISSPVKKKKSDFPSPATCPPLTGLMGFLEFMSELP